MSTQRQSPQKPAWTVRVKPQQALIGGRQANKIVKPRHEGHEFDYSHQRSTSSLGSPLLWIIYQKG